MKSQDINWSELARGWLPWGALAPVLGLLFLIGGALIEEPLLMLLVRLDASPRRSESQSASDA